MSHTHKDLPYRLGGHQTKYFCVSNHGSHGSFTKQMRRQARRELDRALYQTGELLPKTKYQYFYFD